MLKLNFKINKEYLLIHSLGRDEFEKKLPILLKLKNKIWGKYPESYYLIADPVKNPAEIFIRNPQKRPVVLYSEAIKAIKFALQTKEFNIIFKETEQYLKFVKNQWKNNKKEVLKYIKNISGLKIPDKTINVLITHPKLKNGMAMNNTTIGWGHSEDFKNYSTVYLCHEIMHILTDFDKSDIVHALIELMTDNEIRIRLNKKGKYFDIPIHPKRKNLQKKLLPRWKKYLKNKENKNILKLAKKLKRP